MMKKNGGLMFLLLFMGFFLIATAGNTVEASDLTAQEKYEALAKKGIFAGISDNTAGLDQNMNRAQFARVAALILGLEGIGSPYTKGVTEKPFSDVELGSWYIDYIAAAKKAGIFDGYADGTFKPNNDIKVQEMAVATARILGLEPVDDSVIEGAPNWAAGYIQALQNEGIEFPTNYREPAKRSDIVSLAFAADTVITEKKEEQKKKDEQQSEEDDDWSPPPSVDDNTGGGSGDDTGGGSDDGTGGGSDDGSGGGSDDGTGGGSDDGSGGGSGCPFPGGGPDDGTGGGSGLPFPGGGPDDGTGGGSGLPFPGGGPDDGTGGGSGCPFPGGGPDDGTDG